MVLEISPPNAVCGGRARFDAYRELNKLANAQRRMLPQRAPEIPVMTWFWPTAPRTWSPATSMISSIGQTGGVAAFVGDGSGHGPAACLLVATMRTILRIHPDQHTDPGPTLSFAGRTLAPLISSGEFMTGVYLVLEGEGESPGPRLVTTLPLGSVPLVGSPPLT